jgi:hypothetical protein
MRRWSLGFAFALFVAGSVPCLAQQPSGPATLEALLADETRQAAIATEADANAGSPSRPAGTVSRPKDGVQHPDLDRAWADYEAAVGKATEEIRAAISKQFDAATATGNLDTAEKWQVIGEKFEKGGELPAGTETKAAVNTAAADYKNARDELSKAYEAVVKALTIEKKITEAKAVRDELSTVDTRRADGTEGAGVFLADLQEINVSVGWGGFGKGEDLGYEGKSIVVAGRAVKKGLSMVPPSNGFSIVSYKVPKGFTQFKARAAMNDSARGQRTPVVFTISDGNRVLWQSRPLRAPGAGEDCVCDLKGAKTVTLRVHCPGDFAAAHAVWVDPRFLKK